MRLALSGFVGGVRLTRTIVANARQAEDHFHSSISICALRFSPHLSPHADGYEPTTGARIHRGGCAGMPLNTRYNRGAVRGLKSVTPESDVPGWQDGGTETSGFLR